MVTPNRNMLEDHIHTVQDVTTFVTIHGLNLKFLQISHCSVTN